MASYVGERFWESRRRKNLAVSRGIFVEMAYFVSEMPSFFPRDARTFFQYL
jgi:hypothetical protein